MADRIRAGILGATGMVGRRFLMLLHNHPFFDVTLLAASPASAGKPYAQAVGDRWPADVELPQAYRDMIVYDASDIEAVKPHVDFVFCAVDMDKAATRALEEAYARAEIPVVSNNSACRGLPDVPMLVPEVNAAHLEAIPAQRRRLGSERGFIVVKPNCSIQSYVPALTPLLEFGPKEVLACTYQAISGAGKTFDQWPEMLDNVIPYIGGEEEKSEQEPLKLWGRVEDGLIVNRKDIDITTQCLRVPVSDGHLAAVYVRFANKLSREEILEKWRNFRSPVDELDLPLAPRPFLKYFDEADRPQTRLDRDLGRGMAVSIGRLREDTQYDYKFVCLSHNTLRGAAGGGVLSAELLYRRGLLG